LHVRLRIISVVTIFLITATLVFAEGTRTWEQSKFDDLTKGTAKGVAIRSTGGMELAPAFKALTTTPSIYVWGIAADQSGNLYVAAGSPAAVYRITPDGKSEAIFQPKELQVQALVVDKNGAVYAATNPDGKIYRVEHRAGTADTKTKPADTSGWSSSVYFDPATKYIWDLALDDAGNLFVATGDKGEIFRVTPKGDHSVFFKSDETHIRVLAFDLHGNLIAGSDGSGLVYRISPGGEGFVLYSAPKKEITALAIDKDGDIYAAGAGEKHSNAAPISFPSVTLPNQNPPASGQQAGITITNAGPSSPLVMSGFPGMGMSAAGGSEIYRIALDGSPNRLWASHEDLVYALAFDSQGHLLAGTGNRGHVFEITGEDEYTDLIKASATQVTAFAKASDGAVFAATSNLGKIFRLGVKETEGSYESDVLDARIFSRWGRVEFRGASNVEIFARSGNVDNPDRNWSAWKKVDLQKDAEAGVPSARFIQWKAVLHAGDPAPRLDSVVLNYLPKNVAPDFDDVTVQAATHYQPGPKAAAADSGGTGNSQPHFDAQPPSTHDRDSIGVKWTVHDDNDDQMVYSVYYRGDGETRWLLLKDNLTDKFYSFDASLLPDGGYVVEVLASDAPSHSPGQGLTAIKDSARFEVDTTAPQIMDLHAAVEGGQIHVNFRAVDSFSAIKRAEYSIDAGDWQFVEPAGQLSDSKTESYDFHAPVAAITKDKSVAGSSDHVVVVRAYDRFDNMGSAKTVIRGK
jgi:hypothetical protein